MDASALVAAIDERAQHLHTPCGSGTMTWRRWGSGRPVILLHGAYGSWTHWIRNIDALAGSRSVIAADLPGLGDSALPDEPVSLASLAGILCDGLASVLRATERYDLVGFSFGASLGGALASVDQDRIRSLTVIGAGRLTPGRERPTLRTWRHLPSPDERDRVHSENLEALMFGNPAAVDELAVTIQRVNTEHARLRVRAVERRPGLVEALRATPVPVTAIFGANDATAALDADDRLRLAATVPGIHLRVVPAAGHWVQYEAAPVVNQMLAEISAEVAA